MKALGVFWICWGIGGILVGTFGLVFASFSWSYVFCIVTSALLLALTIGFWHVVYDPRDSAGRSVKATITQRTPGSVFNYKWSVRAWDTSGNRTYQADGYANWLWFAKFNTKKAVRRARKAPKVKAPIQWQVES